MQSAAQAPQTDAQLMGAVGVVGFQHGLAIDQDLPGRRLQDSGEGLGTRVPAGEPCGARLFGFGVGALLTQGQAIPALGLAARAQLELAITEQFLGCKQKAFGAASLELKVSLAKLAAGRTCAHRAIVEKAVKGTTLHPVFETIIQRTTLVDGISNPVELETPVAGEEPDLAKITDKKIKACRLQPAQSRCPAP